MYGTLVDQTFIKAPNPIITETTKIYYDPTNPPDALMREHGYKPLVEVEQPTEEPQEGYHWEQYYRQDEDNIYHDWHEVENPEPPEPETADSTF